MQKRKYTSEFKTRIVLVVLKTIGQLTMERDFLKEATEYLKDRGLL